MHQWPPTEAYTKLKRQTQEVFEFSVSVCYGIPSLKYNIRNISKGIITTLPRPDYYSLGQNSPIELKSYTSGYKGQLARYTLLSVFSFFETFIVDIIKETVNFHGGRDKFLHDSQLIRQASIDDNSPNIRKAITIMRKPQSPNHRQRYQKYLLILKSSDILPPQTMFSYYGAKKILEEVDNNLKASRIPIILHEGFGLTLTKAEIDKFNEIREKRNKVAHGDVFNLTIKDVAEYNKFLRDLSKRINQHIVRNFIYRYSVDI